MRVNEMLLSKKIIFSTNEPYAAALDIMLNTEFFGSVAEKTNEYKTDGPRHTARIIFDLIEKFDKFSRLRFTVDISGESNHAGYVTLSITATLETAVNEEGTVSQTLSEFYLNSIFPRIRNMAGSKAKEIVSYLENHTKIMASRAYN